MTGSLFAEVAAWEKIAVFRKTLTIKPNPTRNPKIKRFGKRKSSMMFLTLGFNAPFFYLDLDDGDRAILKS
jgi:hypothetical protein